jgi:glycosyltransferase involved in cell wall biosynthesis
LSYGDAVGNDAVALNDALKRNGYKTGIYAENIDGRFSGKIVQSMDKIPELKADDIVLYHLSTGTALNYRLPKYGGRKVIIYHNVTPHHFFSGYNEGARRLCQEGEEGLKHLAKYADYCLADSEFNKQDMIRAGYTCRIDVLPILIPFSDYKKEPDKNIVRRYQDDTYTNLLFTGRIAPNKKQEDIIRAFSMYQKYYNPRSRLFLVGSYNGMESYYKQLETYARELQLKNVFFTGHIKFNEILAYYKVADYFLCMSEHEGFCVPLVETMCFDVPVIAYDSTAIGGTLGGAGVLLKEKNPLEVAGMLDYLQRHPDIRQLVVEGQRQRLRDFEHDKIEKQFIDYLETFKGGHA